MSTEGSTTRRQEKIAVKTVAVSNQNSLSFIDRLPAEILEDTFIQCAHDHHRLCSFPTPYTPLWVNVSYVSRHWRNVALGCPTLWTYLFIVSPQWTEEQLARSKQAALKVHLIFVPQQDEPRAFRFVEQVLQHSERIQQLVFNFITYPPLVTYDCEWATVLFNRDTQALHTLHLECCPLSWYSLKLNGLTSFTLRMVPVEFQQDITEFLATLGCMPHLRDLYLDCALASASGFLSSAAFHSFRRLDLPHLTQLFVVAPLSTVIVLVSCVNIPLETDVTLGPYCGHNSDDNPDELSHAYLDGHSTLCSLLTQRYDTTPSKPTIRALAIEYPGFEYKHPKLVFDAWECECESCSSFPCVKQDSTIRLQILLSPYQSTTTVHHLMHHIFRCMPLLHVESVRVFNPPSSMFFWKCVVGHLRNLRYLDLRNGDLPDLSSVLSLPSDSDTEDGQDEIFAPELEELTCHDVSFWTSLRRGSVHLLDALVDALSTRIEPHGRVRMTECVERIIQGRSRVRVQRRDFDLKMSWGGGHVSKGPYLWCEYYDRDYPDYSESDEESEKEDGDGDEDEGDDENEQDEQDDLDT